MSVVGDQLAVSRARMRPYVQLYTVHIADIRELISHSASAADLLFVMVEIMGKRNSLVASIPTLMRLTGKSKSTVLRSRELLISSNFVDYMVVDGASVYTVNVCVAWKDKPEFRGRMATFDAKVITFQDEQPDGYDTQKKLKKVAKTPYQRPVPVSPRDTQCVTG